jgi:O-antigen ligase/tetratricopeptide (TPR) repeat protein
MKMQNPEGYAQRDPLHPDQHPDATGGAPPPATLSMLRGLLIGLTIFLILYVQVAMVLVLTFWGVWKLARRERLIHSPLALPIVALLGATVLATAFSIDSRQSFNGLLITLTIVLFFFLFCDLLAGRKTWSPDTLIGVLLWPTTIMLCLGMWKIATHYWQVWQTQTGGYPVVLFDYRLFRMLYHPNLLAAILNLALPFAIIRLARARSGWSRAGWALWLLAYDMVLFFTRSRGGWVAASAAITLTIIWLLFPHGLPHRVGVRSWLQRTWPVLIATLLYVGLFLLLLHGPDLWSQLIPSEDEPVQSSFSTNSAETIVSTLQSHRMVLWRLAWEQFLEHPLTGSGPRTFGYAYVRELHSVRFWISGHAHSLFFEILGTQGAVSVLASGWVVLSGFVVFVRGLWPGTRDQGPGDRGQGITLNSDLLLCVCAALASYLVHSLVEVIGNLPGNDVLVVMLVAIGLSAAGALRREERPMSRWTMGVLLVVPVLAFVLIRYEMGRAALQQAIDHTIQGNWTAGAQAMDEAVAADPKFVFYYGQRGYAYSVLAAPVGGPEDESALRRALQSYARSLQIEPPYMPNLLNTAALLEQAGSPQQAEQVLERAVALPQAHYWALPHLLLADRYAEQGRTEAAEALFMKAFASELHAPEMAACQRSAACRAAAVRAAPEASPTQQAHRQARALLEEGKPAQALAVLETIPLSSVEPLPWFDRANAHLALGQMDRARYALRVGDTMWKSNQYTSSTAAYAALSRAALLLAEGEREQATRALERGVLTHMLADGYSHAIFDHMRLPGKLQPRLDMLQHTADDLAIYRLLVQLYTEQGTHERAIWAQTHASKLAALLAPDSPE